MSDPHAHQIPSSDFAGFDPHETLSTDEYHHFHAHVTPFWPMFWVFAILLVLTALTVWTSNVHGIQFGNTWIEFSGFIHIMIAMGIAVVKALLVAAYFMHLKYDKPMNTVVVGTTIFGVVLFIGLTMLDIKFRGLDDPIQSGEIHKGGNYKLYAGSIAGEDEASDPEAKVRNKRNPLIQKSDMNAATFAKEFWDAYNAQLHADEAHHAEDQAESEPHEDDAAPDHTEDPASDPAARGGRPH